MLCNAMPRHTRRVVVSILAAVALLAGLAPAMSFGQAADATQSSSELGSLFGDFLHYARLGKFIEAEAYAKKLLAHPDANGQSLLELADKDKQSRATLITLIKHTSINEPAQQILDLIREGEYEQRKDIARIRANIERLGGAPQMEFNAIQRLKESGEYAIPEMINALRDSERKNLWPRIIRALPQIGKPAVAPLVIALEVSDRDVRQNVVAALGEIGYPQAVPYLLKLQADPEQPELVRSAVSEALAKIEMTSDREAADSAVAAFVRLANQYYNDHGSVRADARLSTANVWYWDDGMLQAKVVPTEIHAPIMAMRCCEEALLLTPDHHPAIALWLSANFRREARLGMDVESAEADAGGDADSTRPANFPRSIYFARAAGPLYCHMVLGRAVADLDKPVALGAIAALDVVAGASSLVGSEDYKQPLVQALRFPDAEVRIKAAIALARALPKRDFVGSDVVGYVLAEALRQGGQPQYVIVDADQDNLNRLAGEFRGLGADVVAETNFLTAMNRARKELAGINGFVLAANVEDPSLSNAIRNIRSEFRFAQTPIVAIFEDEREYVADDAVAGVTVARTAPAVLGAEELRGYIEEVAQSGGVEPLDTELALELALRTAEALRLVALDGRTVIQYEPALEALIEALNADDEGLQIKSAQVIALIPSQPGQQAVAELALNTNNTDTLRMAAFYALAESAKRHGNLLGPAQVTGVVQSAMETEDLTMRTAASQALGALNLHQNEASEIIRSYYQG